MIDRFFRLDLNEADIHMSNIAINQGNVDSVSFRFRIFDGGKELNYGRFSSARATFSVRGEAVCACPCVVMEDCVIAMPPPQAFAVYGTVTGQLDLKYELDKNLATNYFNFSVRPSLARLPETEKEFFYDEINRLRDTLARAAETAETGRDGITELLQDINRKAQDLDSVIENVDKLTGIVDKLSADTEKSISLVRNILENGEADYAELRQIIDTAVVKFDEFDRELERAIKQNAQIEGIYMNSVTVKEDLDRLLSVEIAQMKDLLEVALDQVLTDKQGVLENLKNVDNRAIELGNDLEIVENLKKTVDNLVMDVDKYGNIVSEMLITSGEDITEFKEIVGGARAKFEDIGIEFIKSTSKSAEISDIHAEALKTRDKLQQIEQDIDSGDFVTKNGMKIFVQEALDSFTPKDSGFQTFKYDLSLATSWWRVMGDAMFALGHAGCCEYQGKVYFWGMEGGGANHLMVHDLESWQWSFGPFIDTPEKGCSLAELNGVISMVGGENNQHGIRLYNVSEDELTMGINNPSGVDNIHMINTSVLPALNRVFVFGGEGPTRTVRVWDPSRPRWTVSLDHSEIIGPGVQRAFTHEDEVFCAGMGASKTQLCRFNPSNSQFTEISRSQMPVNNAAFVPLGGGTFLVHGAGEGPTNQVLIYDLINNTWDYGPPAPVLCTRTRGVFYNGAAYFYGVFDGNPRGILKYAPPPNRIRLLKCSTGDRIYADQKLLTEFGQILPPFTENIINGDGYVEIETTHPVNALNGWVDRK